MKVDKKKIVFASIIGIVLLFIFAYSSLVFNNQKTSENLKQTRVPELEEEPERYTSRLEALDDLEEPRERHIPDMYSESLLDTGGYYDPELLDKNRVEIVDSVYDRTMGGAEPLEITEIEKKMVSTETTGLETENFSSSDLMISNERFFKAAGILQQETNSHQLWVKAQVNGDQTVKNKDRLELVLLEDLVLGQNRFQKHTLLYGQISLQPNRVLIRINTIQGQTVNLEAYDLQDRGKGIYIKNSVREEAGRKVLEDLVQDVNLTGFPQVGGLKNIFRRNNKNIKVTILDQYQLILKPSL